MARKVRRAASVMMVALSLMLGGSARVQAQAPAAKYRAYQVRTPDGLTIQAQGWGNPGGPGILFIHGFAQSHLSFVKQTSSELSAEFHLVTYDLRGHGSSDQPLEPEKYKSAKLWGDELQAVMDTACLKRPVLVGWSYAGRVIIDYLATHGQDGLAGLVLVDATTRTGPTFNGPGIKTLGQMTSEDIETNIDATRAFLHACFAKQPSPDEFETMLAFNMMVPVKVRAAMGGRPLDADAVLKRLTLPVLVVHGSADQLLRIEMANYTAAAIPGARLSVYEGSGHAPFWEDAPRFNRELAEFVRAVQKP